jgi:glycosyltransferase involved in cell wall biosynthesis
MKMGEDDRTPWVCAQLGSREHYAIPRALHRAGRLRLLLTDYWSSARGGLTGLFPGRDAGKAAQRFHPELATVPVVHLGARRLLFEASARLRRRSGWEAIMRRNRLFQDVLLRRLEKSVLSDLAQGPGVCFAYSYASLDLLRAFKGIGWKTILGQIDPGIREEEIVAAENARHPDLCPNWSPAPADYWRNWREECNLADRIMVNSEWSRDALVDTGVPAAKVDVVPLAFEGEGRGRSPRNLPERFSAERPLRVLFLGQLTLRKGVHLALEAAREMRDAPIEWRFVGPADFPPPPDLAALPRVVWSGPVSRAETTRLYADADVFLLPTLSDGFALTQLEAQAAGLPVIASRHCGTVVRDGINGWVLDPLTPATIVATVIRALENPARLETMARASGVAAEFSLASLQRNLIELERKVLNA